MALLAPGQAPWSGSQMTKRLLNGLFSKWFFLTYFGLGVAHFVAFPLVTRQATLKTSLFQTIGLMSGSDPYIFKEATQSYLTIWTLGWLIHIASWLFIPGLIALVITDARDEIRKKQSLDAGFASLAGDAGVKHEDIPGVVEELNAEVEKALHEILRKGQTS